MTEAERTRGDLAMPDVDLDRTGVVDKLVVPLGLGIDHGQTNADPTKGVAGNDEGNNDSIPFDGTIGVGNRGVIAGCPVDKRLGSMPAVTSTIKGCMVCSEIKGGMASGRGDRFVGLSSFSSLVQIVDFVSYVAVRSSRVASHIFAIEAVVIGFIAKSMWI